MINKFTIEEVRKFWDQVAESYEPTNKKIGYVHTQRFEKAIKFGQIKPDMKILNIWSRTGNFIPYLRKIENLEIKNLEVSPAMIKIAESKYPNEKFGLTDLENLSELNTGYFDRVISLETLEHTPRPLKFLGELYRVLRPGGFLIMSAPPKGEEIPEFIYKLFFHDHGEGPHNFPWPGQVKKMLRDVGFTIVAHKPFVIMPFGNDELTRKSEKILTKIFRKTPLANFGYRHFYIAKK